MEKFNAFLKSFVKKDPTWNSILTCLDIQIFKIHPELAKLLSSQWNRSRVDEYDINLNNRIIYWLFEKYDRKDPTWNSILTCLDIQIFKIHPELAKLLSSLKIKAESTNKKHCLFPMHLLPEFFFEM